MSTFERRFTAEVVEVRAQQDRPPRIGGYAAKFNKRSHNLGGRGPGRGWREVVDPGFFRESQRAGFPDVLARYNHDDNMLLGTTGGGTLDLRVDPTGLLYEVEPPRARDDVLELVQRGDVRQSSFAFRSDPETGSRWERVKSEGIVLRTLLTGELVDVAPVNTPAYPDTSTALRSLAAQVEAPLDEVRALADAGELDRFFTATPGGTEAVRAALQRRTDLLRLRAAF